MNHSNDETFLSRIFGLHSVYNQLNNEYQYYDDTNDLENNFNSVNSINLSGLNSPEIDNSVRIDNSFRDNNGKNNSNKNVNSSTRGNNNLLDSESDSEDEESTNTIPNTINWETPKPDLSTRLKANKSIKFNLPKNTKSKKKFKLRFQIPPKERALYLWANIINMDEFLNDIYYYYQNKGLNNIVLSKIIDLLILIFLLWFIIFLKWGINYQQFQNWDNNEQKLILKDLIISNYIFKIPNIIKFLLFGFINYIILRSIQLYFDYNYKLKEIQNFYIQLIGIKNDQELMTISWMKIIEKLLELKNFNSLTSSDKKINDLNSKIRLNPQDIANRIMRKENYFIALINKNIINLSMKFGPLQLNNSQLLTRTLEWNLKLCIFNFIFNNNGQINPKILKDFNRNQLSTELNKRFKMAAIINLILSPFLVIYFILLYFFSNFNEYRLNPSYLINLRQFTPFAEWKLREFNELPHFFNKRLKLSFGPSNTYINQFPSNFLIVNLNYLVNFISGSILTILIIFGLIFQDEDHNFWSFELTENKSTLFYISIFGTIFAITSNSTSEPSSKTYYYDPEASIKYVSQFTHYLPLSWNGKLHTQEIKNQYCQLFNLKILIILNEITLILLTPFLLWFKISYLSSSIIDFFRDYSIHIDGLGYICYFSMFNFEQKDKNMMVSKPKTHQQNNDHDDFYHHDDKMIKSYMYFLENYQDNPPSTNDQNNSNGERKAPFKSHTNIGTSTHSESPMNSNFLSHNSYQSYRDSEDEDEIKLGKSGVLGMLNQFYRQDLNKN